MFIFQYSRNWFMSSNPRITTIGSSTKQENLAASIITSFRINSSATLHWVLSKFIQCNIIKDQPQFIEILFANNLSIMVEMLDWMFIPKVIAKRKKIKTNIEFFPYRCKQFLKQNCQFYQWFYCFALNNNFCISDLFKFLREQYYDQESVLGALGYFSQVFVPFAKYEFIAHHRSIKEDLLGNLLDEDNECVMKILPKKLIKQLIKFTYYQPIFQFLKQSALSSLDGKKYEEYAKQTLMMLFKNCQKVDIFDGIQKRFMKIDQVRSNIDIMENIAHFLKQQTAKIEQNSDIPIKTQKIIDVLLTSKLIPYIINQLVKSKYCNPTKSKQNLFSSQQLYSTRDTAQNCQLSRSYEKIPICQQKNVEFQEEVEELMEVMVQILTYCVEIFVRIPKTIQIMEQQVQEPFKSEKQVESDHYQSIVLLYHQQMQYLLDNLEKMTKILYNESSQSIPNSKPLLFSSGQKIKQISFMKYHLIKLIHNSLVMIQCPQALQAKIEKSKSLKKLKSIIALPFQLKIENLNLIQIIQKYLTQNKWNNIAHHLLEKLCHSLILCNYQYLRKNIQRGLTKKLSNSFITFLIQNFAQKHYIFLNTFKFTSQGNLHSLYNMSKDLAYTLNNTNELVILLNQFGPWKKFIMDDLKSYEEKVYPVAIKPNQNQLFQEKVHYDVLNLHVDEADSIRKLIQNISEKKKQSYEQMVKKKRGPKSNQKDRRSKFESPSKLSIFIQKKYQNQETSKETLDDILKKKVEYNIKFESDQSVQQIEVNDISIRERLCLEKNHLNINNLKLAPTLRQ